MESRLAPTLDSSGFDRVFSDGYRASGKFCRVLVAAGKGRIGYSTPKKVGCHARRNRMKRRLKNAVLQIEILKNENLDIVILGRVEADRCDFQALVRDLSSTLAKSQFLWENGSESR